MLGTGLTASLAGCSLGSEDEHSSVRIGFKNFTDEQQQIDVGVIRPDGDDLSKSQILNTVYDIPVTKGTDASPVVKEEIESRPYIIRADLFATEGMDGHYHFLPDCADNETKDMILLTISPHESNGPTVRFSQQRC